MVTLAFLIGLLSLTATNGLADGGKDCGPLSYYAGNFAPLGYTITHDAIDAMGVVTAANHAAWVDSVYLYSSYLDSVPDTPYVVVEQQKDFPDRIIAGYYDLLSGALQIGDEICRLHWTLYGTEAGTTSFYSYGFSRNGFEFNFEPMMYLHITEAGEEGDKEGTSKSGYVRNGFGIKTATWTITIDFECNNCRIIDEGPYTTVQPYTWPLFDIDYDFIETKYFREEPCCPEDKLECLKVVVKIAVTSGGRTAVTIKHKDWIEVKFEGWFGWKAEYPYTFRECCEKEVTAKPTTYEAVPTSTFVEGEVVCFGGDNYPPSTEIAVFVVANTELVEGMAIPVRVPGTATAIFTGPLGEIAGTTLKDAAPVLMPAYMPNLVGDRDMGYDLIVDLNGDGIWSLDEPALDVSAGCGFGSGDALSSVPGVESLAVRTYPNPFNPSTTIEYHLPRDGDIRISIYNVRGQLVRVLLDDHVTAGFGSVGWNGLAASGEPVSSGVYFAEVRALGKVHVTKIAMIK